MTNFDKIKTMDIEDLTQLLYDDACLHCWFYHNTDDKTRCDLRKCKFYVKKWLLQEAD